MSLWIERVYGSRKLPGPEDRAASGEDCSVLYKMIGKFLALTRGFRNSHASVKGHCEGNGG